MSQGLKIAVLDYGIGNLRSAQKAFEHVGADAILTADRAEIDAADAVVLPGVGAFGACVDALGESGLDVVALDVIASGRPFIGICVGMQVLFSHGVERGVDTEGTVRAEPALPTPIWHAVMRRLAKHSNC